MNLENQDYLKLCYKLLRDVTQLNLEVTQLNAIEESVSNIKESLFLDLQIVCSDSIFPCHKNVLKRRCEVIGHELSSGINELNWSCYRKDSVLALLRWIYTGKIESVMDSTALGLLHASFDFDLHALFESCELMLVNIVNKSSAIEFYKVAENVGSNMLMKKCLEFLPSGYDGGLNERLNKRKRRLDKSDQRELKRIKVFDEDNTVKPEGHVTIEKRKKLKELICGIIKYLNHSDYYISHGSCRRFPAHANILSTHSDLIRNEIALNPERKTTRIHFPTNCSRAILRWMYTDTIVLDNDDPTSTLQLLRAAHTLHISFLLTLSEEAICTTTTINECAKLIRTAKKIGSKKLFKRCKYLLSTYWNGLQSSDLKKFSNIYLNVITPDTQPQNAIMKLETSKSKIEMLSDDCILQIFKYVSWTDLSSLKSTCVKFNYLADEHYKLYGNKSLSIHSSSMFADFWNLQHFGELIHSVTIDDIKKYIWSWDDIFAMVAKFCTSNLKRICLNLQDSNNIEDECLKRLKEIFKNVEIIELTRFLDNRHINLTLSYCENLQEIHLSDKNLDLDTLWCVKNSNIKRITMKIMKNDLVLEEICKHLLHLEYLDFDCDQISNSEINKMNKLAQLDHLKKLKIGCPDTSLPIVLQNLANKNLLEYLSLPYIDMTPSIARALGDFTKLKELTLSRIENFITEELLFILSRKLLRIEKLFFHRSHEITFAEITIIIEKNKKLKELMIISCNKIESIDKENYIKLQKQKLRNLKIFVDTQVYKKTIELISDDLSPLVQVLTIPPNWNRWHL